MRRTDTNDFEAMALVFGSFYAAIHDRSLVTRRDYDNLLRAARRLYDENRSARTALADLEKLASSWTGTPERSSAIVHAREVLAKGRP